jgi:ATP-dependent Zn protease
MKLEAVAFHEAGHAVVARRERIEIKRVSIVPDTERAGKK